MLAMANWWQTGYQYAYIIKFIVYGAHKEDVHDDDTVVVPDILVIRILLFTFLLFTERHCFINRRHYPIRNIY